MYLLKRHYTHRNAFKRAAPPAKKSFTTRTTLILLKYICIFNSYILSIYDLNVEKKYQVAVRDTSLGIGPRSGRYVTFETAGLGATAICAGFFVCLFIITDGKELIYAIVNGAFIGSLCVLSLTSSPFHTPPTIIGIYTEFSMLDRQTYS